MSYRNPKQVVDTQSGQHVRDMMKSVTGDAVNFIKTNQAKLKKRQKENVERQQYLNEANGRYANAVNAADIKNAGTDWSGGLAGALKRHSELIAQRRDDPLGFSLMDAKELSYLQTLPTTIKEQSVQTEARMQGYNDSMAKGMGNYGGLDMFGNPEEYEQTNVEGQVGTTSGKSIGEYSFNRELGIGNAKVTSYRSDGTEIGTDANRNFNLPIVPDPTKDFQAISVILKKSGIEENQYKKNENGTKFTVLKRSPVEGGDNYSVEVQPVDMKYLMRQVRAQTDSYVESLDVQGAIRLVNNKARDLKDKIPGMEFLGDVGNIVDPDKSTWTKNAQGQVIDPELERTKIAVARLYIRENDLGKEREIRRINDKKRTKIKNTESSFLGAIKNFSPEIETGAGKIWELKGEGDDRYYFLPAPTDSDGMQKAGTKDRKINYYIYPKGVKTINEINMRAGMMKVRTNN